LPLRDSIARLVIALLLAVNIYFAATEPCTSAEAVVYQRYASHPILDYWNQPFDPHLGLVYGILARIATRVGGVSELTIRIPAIVGGLLFWLVLANFLPGWAGLLVFVAIAANPWTYRAFSSVSGGALAAGLLAAAAHKSRKNLTATGVLIALAVGADGLVALPAIALVVAIALVLRIEFWRWMDKLVIPSVVLVLFLCPVLLTRERAFPADSQDTGMRQLIHTLMHQPHKDSPLVVGVSHALQPGLFFYRRRYHLDWMVIRASGLNPPPGADINDAFELLTPDDFAATAGGYLHLIEKAPGAVLARQ
jgi:hypothetical protein